MASERVLELLDESIRSSGEAQGLRELGLGVLRDYASGEQFREGAYWRGRRPDPAAGGFDEVKRHFAQDDLIGPSLKAIVDGVLAREPVWKLAQGDAEPMSDSVWNDALEVWSKQVDLHTVLRMAKYAEQWGGRGFLRLYIPPSLGVVEPGVPGSGPLRKGSLGDLQDALSRVRIMSADALSGGLVRDEFGMLRGIYFLYEYLLPDGGGWEDRVELHSDGLIEHFVWRGNFSNSLELVPGLSRVNPFWVPGDFGGLNYLMFPLEREWGSSITPGIRDKQDHLSASSTDLRRNGSLAGFPTWVFANLKALDNTNQSRTESGVVGGSQSQISTKAGVPLGPGQAFELIGLEVRDGAGNVVGFAAPEARRLEPVNPEGTLKEIDHWRAALLREFDRLWTETHLLSVSGVSRQEARNAWDKRLLGETASTHEAIRWVMRSALRLGLWLTGEELPDDLRVVPTLHVDVAPANLETYRSLLEGYDRNVVSIETLIDHLPIENVDADVELARVRRQAEEQEENEEEQTNEPFNVAVPPEEVPT